MTKKDFVLRMQSDDNSLLSPKDLYWQNHTASGVNVYFNQLSERDKRILRYENLHLAYGMDFVNGMPIVSPYNGSLDFKLVPYTKRNRHSGKGDAVHFFLNDYEIKSVWNHLERTTHDLFKFDVLFAPDFSVFVNDDMFIHTNKTGIYRSRFIAAYWQRCGYNVIPVASWGDVNSLKYCFEGLPEDSVIAVGGIGHMHCSAAKRLWHYAIDQLVETKHPSTLIVYGGDDTPSLKIPVVHFEDFITQKLRKL